MPRPPPGLTCIIAGLVSRRVIASVRSPAISPVRIRARKAEPWLNGAWYMSPTTLSAANFQLQGICHLVVPGITSQPPGRRLKTRSL